MLASTASKFVGIFCMLVMNIKLHQSFVNQCKFASQVFPLDGSKHAVKARTANMH